MEIEEFKEKIKKEGPNIRLSKNKSVDIVSNRQDIPIKADPPKKDEYITLKIYYDNDNNVYRYSQDSESWSSLDEQQLESIFYSDIKPFIL